MHRRPVSMLGLLVLLLATSAAGAPASASSHGAVRGFRVEAGVFSPNGDGSDDTLVIRYHLPRDADVVQLRISELSAGTSRHVRLIQVGSTERGSHSWTSKRRMLLRRRLGMCGRRLLHPALRHRHGESAVRRWVELPLGGLSRGTTRNRPRQQLPLAAPSRGAPWCGERARPIRRYAHPCRRGRRRDAEHLSDRLRAELPHHQRDRQ